MMNENMILFYIFKMKMLDLRKRENFKKEKREYIRNIDDIF